MVAKSIQFVDSARVTQHLDELMNSHRQYFSDWRSDKFKNTETKSTHEGTPSSETYTSVKKKWNA
jgi:hypothetical protein